MTLRNIQRLEMIWVVLGLLFNTVSYWQLQKGESALSATDPIAGNVFMTICGIVVVLGLKGFKKIYKYSIPFLTLSLAYGGWWLHVYAYLTDSGVLNYASTESWLTVIIINTFGLAVMVLGSWQAFFQTNKI